MLAPAAPLLLLDQKFFCFVQLLGCFTMFPLLVKDKLRVPYLACCGLYLSLTCLLDGPEVDSTAELPKGAKKQTMERLYAKLAMTKGDIVRQMGWLGELLAIEPVKSVLIGLSVFGKIMQRIVTICPFIAVICSWRVLYFTRFLSIVQVCSHCICWKSSCPRRSACQTCTRLCSRYLVRPIFVLFIW